MKRFARFGILGLVCLGVAATGLVVASSAEALTCKKACSQARRACNKVATNGVKGDFAFCSADFSSCRIQCDATQSACLQACVADPDPAACEAACFECRPDCRTAVILCRDTAKATRAAARVTCDTNRAICNGACVGPVDDQCVRTCGSDQRVCENGPRQGLIDCKRDCRRATARSVCIAVCNAEFAQALEPCVTEAVGCIEGCIGVAP